MCFTYLTSLEEAVDKECLERASDDERVDRHQDASQKTEPIKQASNIAKHIKQRIDRPLLSGLIK